ncbi:hypothetical protein I79_008605 [Cricetulus griseus]|uniref:Uncharacterized protein n=1 Tax=Cricetulus griseus TaxID=10029 RepID=G3HDM1_CRIGR|nr:hypothetical protein I79_008605 [Cricetulus griseus]
MAPVGMSIICKESPALNFQLEVNDPDKKPLVTGMVLSAPSVTAHLLLMLPSPSSIGVGQLKVATL